MSRTKSRSGEVGRLACKHPGCPIPLRLVYSATANTLTAYHGEDEIAKLERFKPTAESKTLEAMMQDSEADTAKALTLMGIAMAFQIAELHGGTKQ